MNYQAMISAAGWTYEEAARRLGVHPAIVVARVAGEMPVTQEAELALRYLVENATPEDLGKVHIGDGVWISRGEWDTTLEHWGQLATQNLTPRRGGLAARGRARPANA